MQEIQQTTEIVQSGKLSGDGNLQQYTDAKETLSPGEIQEMNEQQLESVTGGGNQPPY